MIYKGTLGIALVALIISLFVAPVLGLEMINVLQMAFLSLCILPSVQPVLATIGELYPMINGYNRLFDIVPNIYDMNSATLSKLLNQMRAGPRFLTNLNYMLFVEIIVIGITLIFVLVGKKYSKTHPLLKTISRPLSVLSISLIAFNSLNLGFGIGMEFVYVSQPNYSTARFTLNIVAGVVGVALQVLCCVFMVKQPELLPFPNEKALKIEPFKHFIVFTSYRFLIGLIIGGFHQINPAAVLLGFQCLLLAFLLYSRPYINWFITLRAILNELAIFTIFLVGVLYTYILT